MTAHVRQLRRDRRARFTQADISRAIKAALAAGVSVQSVTIDPDGRIVVTIGVASERAAGPASPLDAWRASRRES